MIIAPRPCPGRAAVRWAVLAALSVAAPGAARAGTAADSNLKPHPSPPALQYTNSPAPIPNYLEGQRWGTQGEAISRMQLPMAPADSARHLVTLPGFTATLWAAEPDILKPICMAWDERGRLWIAETVDYPNELQPKDKGRDRIKVCEDTNGDGKADRFTVFAEGLSIPTGMVFARGGLIVVENGRTLFLRDQDGDGKADERVVLFSGWGMGDTHATASNLRYGPDNWIWGVVGYSGFDGEVNGRRIKFGMGVYRFRPDGSALEFVRSSNNNTWGLGFSEEGTVFGSTANNNASWYMAVPNRYYEAVSGWTASRMESIADKQDFYPVTTDVRQVDAHGRYTAGAGHALYTARNFPAEHWNRSAFVAEPTGHLVGLFRLEAQGADFVARNQKSFLASSDEWCAPIMAEVGPDGAVWVLDWYNYIIQHNPTPHGFKNGKGNAYETPLRDKRHGRIYRVAWDKARKVAPLDLSKASPAALVQALRNDNQLWRLHAQRLLVERADPSVVPALARLVRDASVDPVGLNVGAQHALWTLAGLGAHAQPDARKAIQDGLRHRSAAVRRAAIAALPRDGAASTALGSHKLAEDSDAQVRLAALLAYSEMPASDPVGALAWNVLREERNASDRWITHAATSAGARHHAGFLRAATQANKATGNALVAEPVRAALRTVAQHQAATAPAEALETTLALGEGPSAVATAILDGFVAGWNASNPPALSDSQRKSLEGLASRLDDAARGSLIALGDRWNQRAIFASLVEATAKALRGQMTGALPDAERIALARRLVSLDDRRESIRAILALVTPQTPPSLVAGLISAAGTSRDAGTAEELLSAFPSLTPAARRAAIGTLVRRAEWASMLLAAVESGRLDRSDLAWDHWDQLRGHPDKQVAAKAAQVEGRKATRTSADMEATVQRLMPVAGRTGDVERGRKAFETTCMVCHAFNGRGQHVGPDLTGMGARPKGELLVEIIDPNRSVEANYRLWTVVRRDGESVSGRLDAETATSVDILDTTGMKHSIQRKDIARIESSQQSIMPSGFDQLPADDLAGILEYIATAGRAK